MKRIVLSAALLIGLISIGFAQQSTDNKTEKKRHKNHERRGAQEIKSPEERARLFTASLDKQLNLTEAQEKEIYTIQLENAKKFDAMRQEHRTDARQNHTAGKSFKDGMDKINNVLTAEQRVAYQKLKEERMKKMKEHRASGQNGKGDSTKARRMKSKKAM